MTGNAAMMAAIATATGHGTPTMTGTGEAPPVA